MSNPAIRRGAGFAALALAAGMLAAVPAAHAQFARASLAGTVTDGAGLALPGVTVTATNADTGAVRVVTTSGAGRYILNGLIPGPYNLSFELPSFRPVRQDGLQLVVGQEATLNVSMELGGIEETVVVTAEAPVVDVTSKEVGATVTTETMEALPTQSRSFIDFAGLIPGVVPNVATASTAADSIFVNGQDNNNNSFNVDGANNDDDVIGGSAGAQTRTAIEAVQEFQILTTQFDAEFGRTQGGVINAVTKSGTNDIRGTAFYYYQGKELNAPNFFTERNDQEKPDIRFQSIGGVLGGPIIRDRFHFFGSFERLTPEEGIARTFETRPELSFVTTEDNLLRNALVKFDYQLNDAHKAAVRYLQEYSPQYNQIIGGATTLDASREEQDTDTSVIGSLDSVVGDRGFNNLRVSFTEEDVAFANPGFNNNGQTFEAQRALDVSLSRDTVLEGASTVASHRINRSYQVDDTFSIFVPDWAGDHNIRMGFNFSRRSVARNNSSTANGQFGFDTDDPWSRGDVSTYPNWFNVRVGGSSGENASVPKNNVYGAFFQDDWQPRENLTLNLGVRWDKEDLTDDNNNIGPRIGLTWDPFGEGRTAIKAGFGRFFERFQLGFYEDYYFDAAQLPFGFTTRVPGAGNDPQMFFDIVHANGITSLNGLRDFLAAQLESGNTGGINSQPTVPYPGRVTPYADTVSIGVQHEVAGATSIGADVIHTRNRQVNVSADLNPFSRNLGQRPNISVLNGEVMNFGSIRTYLNAGESDYTALQLSLRRRFSDSPIGRMSFTASYTAASQKGNVNAGGVPTARFQSYTQTGYDFDSGQLIGEPLALNMNHPANTDRPSPWFRTHNFVTSWSWLVPGTSWADSAGLYVTGIFRYLSGSRDTLETNDREDNNWRVVAPAGSYRSNRQSDIAQTTDFDGKINGLEEPDFAKLDISFRYALPVGGRYEITLLGDIFNVLNRVNYNQMGSDIITSGGFLIPTAAYPPREMQLGVRFTF